MIERLRRGLDKSASPTSRTCRRRCGTRAGTRTAVHAAVAVGHDRHRLQPEEDRRQAHRRQRPVRPEVQGPRDVPQRMARLDGADAAGRRRRARRRHRRRRHEADRQARRRRPSGQIRRFTGNDYAKDLLAKGNVWACVAWSGDIVQLQADNPDLEFLHPRGRRGHLVGQHDDPAEGRAALRRRDVDELLLRPPGGGPAGRLRQLHLAGRRRQEVRREDRSGRSRRTR